MSSLAKPLRRLAARIRVAALTRRGLASLDRSDHPRAGQLADALRRDRSSASEPEDQWMTRIEGMRARMEQSTEKLHTNQSVWSGDPADTRVVEEDLSVVTRTASKPPRSAAILFSLVRSFQPQRAIELGTCVGISCSYQAAALRLNGGGRLWSFDASNGRSAAAGRLLDELDLTENTSLLVGLFDDTLEPVLESLDGPVDYAFIDGHHDEVATWRYFEQLHARSSPDTVMVFDDIHWSQGMKRVWARIAADERVGAAVDLGEMGICLLTARSAPLDAPSPTDAGPGKTVAS